MQHNKVYINKNSKFISKNSGLKNIRNYNHSIHIANRTLNTNIHTANRTLNTNIHTANRTLNTNIHIANRTQNTNNIYTANRTLNTDIENILISIIMPTYNCKNYIIKSINSVINQSYKNWELIIIDDCSTDNTYDTVIKHIDQFNLQDKIKIIRNEVNKGCYCSINEGILLSKGEYICKLDADDTYHIDKLKIQKNILDNKKYICTMSYYMQNNNIIKRNKLSCCTIMMKREVISKVGYFDSVRYSADDEFAYRLIKVYGNNRIHMLNKVLYYSIIRQNSLTTNPKTGFKNKSRLLYINNAIRWHKTNKNLYISYPLYKRPFYAIPSMIGN